MPKYKKLPELKHNLLFCGANIVDDYLFVVGGCDVKGTAKNLAQMCNISGGTCFVSVKDLPRAKAGSSVVSIDNKLVTIGGIYNRMCQLKNVDIYDTTKQLWYYGPDLPTPTQNIKTLVKDDVIYCVGGMTGNYETLSTLLRWDQRCPTNTTEQAWEQLPSMENTHYDPGVFIRDNCLYVIGGRREKMSVRSCECYDLAAGKWRNLPSIPDDYKFVFSSYVQLDDDTVCVMGGLSENPQDGFTKKSFKFDMKSEKWDTMPDMLNARGDFSAFGTGDGGLIVCGGLGFDKVVPNSVEKFSDGSWLACPDLPTSHASSCQCQYKGSLYIIGGLSPTGPSKSVTKVSV